MDVSIIIVNWNSAAYTAACVSSIREGTQGLQYEIIVVDNASTDNSLELLKQIPGIRLVVSSVNLGFARANNLGYWQSSGRVLLFLNPDTYVQEPAIPRMYAGLLSRSDLGIVGCKLLNTDQSLQTSCVQAFPTILNQLTDVEALKVRFPGVRMWGISALFREQPNPVPVEVVSGACLMIQREIFTKVGMFSTDYFMYGEDVDLCHKVAQAGLRVAYVAQATVIHHGGQSSKKKSDSFFGAVVTHETTRLFLAKTRGAMYARMYRCSMCLAAMVRLVLLTLAAPSWLGKDGEGVSSTRRKWKRILRWSLGREGWVNQLNGSTKVTSRTATAQGA
jgi:N-acetylglucosaminyl-diphospho-decaprenol L-rhamnosyltransferase